MKYKNMNTDEIINLICTEQELSKSTRKGYQRSIRHFEKITGQKLPEVLETAEKEHHWKTSNLRQCLIIYRKELHHTYKKSTAKEYFTKIISVLNYFEIQYGRLPKLKKTRETILRDTSELPTQEILKKCIELKNNNIVKSTTLLLSSTGLSPIDLLKLTVKDYLTATSDYHNYNKHHNIIKAIHEMDDKKVIATFKGHRQKTGMEYVTFTSPEAIKSTNIYLLSREDELKPKNRLFKISRTHLNRHYKDINDQLGLGVTSEGTSKYSLKNLRSYHATQLSLAGMSDNKIDILEGRKPVSIIRRHYIKIDTDALREEYIKCLPYLVIDDMERVQSELDIVREEKEVLEQENTKYKEDYNKIWEEINNLQARQDAWDELKKNGVK